MTLATTIDPDTLADGQTRPAMLREPARGGDLSPLQIAWQRKWMLLILAGTAAALMLAATRLMTPIYTAEADLRIDVPQPRVADVNTTFLPVEAPSLEVVRTYLAALGSPVLARDAAVAMNLVGLPAFQKCPKPFLAALLGRLGGAAPAAPACAASPEIAGKALQRDITVGTDRSSFIIQVQASAASADLAARLANGFAAAFVAREHAFRSGVSEEAEAGLGRDVADIRARMLAADAGIEHYRQSHGLVGLRTHEMGGGPSTVAEAQLEQRSQDLSSVTALLAERRSTLQLVRAAVASGRLEAMAPALSSTVIQQLLVRHGELAANVAELRANYGSAFPGVAAAEAALARNAQQTRAEALKLVSSVAGEVSALEARRAAIAADVAVLQSGVATQSSNTVSLAELENEAQSDRTLYENLFLRQKQVAAERRLQPPAVAIAVEAVPPDFPAFPKTRLMVAGAFLGSLGLATGLAFALHMGSRGFRDASQVEDEIGLPVIGLHPMTRRVSPQDVIVDHPLSVEAEAVQGTLATLLGDRTARSGVGKVVLITSALPREGKSSLSVALGRSAMRSGFSGIVLDCDVRRPSIRTLIDPAIPRATAPSRATVTEGGLAMSVEDIALSAGVDARSGLRHICLADFIGSPQGLLGWPALTTLLTHLRENYDLIVLDTPPVLAVADAIKLGHFADQVVLMASWPATPRNAVVAAVRALRRAQVQVTGIVLGRVDLRRYARMVGEDGFYTRSYRDYHVAIAGPV